MTELFIPGNPKTYRAVQAFRDLKKVNWHQYGNINVNDIVYIYIGGNVQQIKLKCIVTKINLPKPEIDDIK